MDVMVGDVPVYEVSIKAKKDYLWDFRSKDNGRGSENIMVDGDIVASFVFSLPPEITLDAGPTNISNDTAVTASFNFSAATAGVTYLVGAIMTTDSNPPRVDSFPIKFNVINYGD